MLTKIKINNYEVVKGVLQAELANFSVLGLSSENEAVGRSNRAELNKIKKNFNDERIKISKDLKMVYDSLIELVDEKIDEFDKWLEFIETERKEKVLQEIKDYYEALDNVPDFMELFNEKWLNKTADWKKEVNHAVMVYKKRKAHDEGNTVEAKDVYAYRFVGLDKQGVEMMEKAFDIWRLDWERL